MKAKRRVETAEDRVASAGDRLAAIEEISYKATGMEALNWEQRALEAKVRLYDERVNLAEAKLNLAEVSFAEDEDNASKLRFSELKTAVAKAEYEKANNQLDLATKRHSAAIRDDEKAIHKDHVDFCRDLLRIAKEKISRAHEEEKRNWRLAADCDKDESATATQLGSPAHPVGTKRKGSAQGFDQGGCKSRKSEKLQRECMSPAWQWRHADGMWMNYSEKDSSLIDEARNRRESTCTITVGGKHFVIDFERMQQCRADVGSEASGSSVGQVQDVPRPIRRWLEEWSEDSVLRWNAHIREVYPSWDDQTREVQVCTVEQDTNDYRKVETLLFDGSGSVSEETHEICRVLRFQNVWTLSRYENEKKALTRKRNGGVN